MEFGIRLCDNLILILCDNLILILFCLYNIRGRELYLCNSFKNNNNNFNTGLCSDIYRPIYFKHGLITEIAELYILMSV